MYLYAYLDKNHFFVQLTTPCEDLVKKCRWQGHAVNCSKMFYLRLTFEGYCCVFNYVKNTSEWWMRRASNEILGELINPHVYNFHHSFIRARIWPSRQIYWPVSPTQHRSRRLLLHHFILHRSQRRSCHFNFTLHP